MMALYKLVCFFILATGRVKAERFYESNSTTWKDVTCTLVEPQLTYHNGLFEVNETLTISDDVWIGYLYVKVPFLLLGCSSLQMEIGVYVNETGYCFTICEGGTFGIKKKIPGQSGGQCICVMGSWNTTESRCIGGDQNSLCNDCYEIYTQINDPTATATIEQPGQGQWSIGNKLCLTNGRHPSFERSITNTGFGSTQEQYFWTGVIRSNILMKLSLTDFFSRVSRDRYVYANRTSMKLWIADNDVTRKALCVTATESTSRQTYSSTYTTEVTTLITTSTHSDTSLVLTKVTTPDVATTSGSTSSLQTTHIYTTLETNYESLTSHDGIFEGSSNNSEKSPAVGIGIGVSVGILFLVGGAVVIVVLRRRGTLHCNRKTGNNKPSENKNDFKENMTYGKNIEDNNYFILEKCGQSLSNNAEHYNESNEANMEEDYNTIQETEAPYEHVNVENYDDTANALTSGSDARKPENVYNKLKIDRPRDNSHVQRHRISVVQGSEDDYDTTSAVVTHGKDDVSDYNHIPHSAYKAAATAYDTKGDTEGDYDAINSMKFKVAQSDDSDYAQVNKDRIK